MEKVYEHSWCNISATKATNSHSGLFSDQDPSSIRIEVDAQWTSRQPTKYYCWSPDFWERYVDDAELHKRAWVVQERVLAPRILQFAEGEVFWECYSLRACESFPQGIPDKFGVTSFKPSQDTQPFSKSLLRPYRTPELLQYRLWEEYVREYTKGKLTNPTKDKLVAISGLARKIGPPEDYLAGLWKPILAHQLFWRAEKNCTRQKEWRAPSWSWASIDGPVLLDIPAEQQIERVDKVLFDVLQAHVSPISTDSFELIQNGVLHLKASLLRAKAYNTL